MPDKLAQKIEALDWQSIGGELHQKGYALAQNILSEKQCQRFIHAYNQEELYRKTVTMERYRFGSGEYKYYDYPLPKPVQTLRELLYSKLAPVANHWMDLLNIGKRFPLLLQELHAECQENDQLKPTPLILRYGQGGFNTLHQDLYGEVYFPLQAAIFLNQPDIDFSGGEFVLTEQVPRAQSKVKVFRPQQGDMMIFTTNFRPVKGSRGYYRATMKHGVSEITKGNRHTLGIIFHDAIS